MKWRVLVGSLTVVLSGASAASDDVGWILDSSNWRKAEGLLPEPVMRRLKSGDYSYRVVDVPGAAFRENSEWETIC